MTRRGFTIVELLTVVAVLGILASIALLKSGQSRDRALRTTMIVDLKNLVAIQESFFSANQDYAGGIAANEKAGTGGKGRITFTPSGNNVLNLTYHGKDGWSAKATNKGLLGKPKTCGIFVGPLKYSPNKAVDHEAAPECW